MLHVFSSSSSSRRITSSLLFILSSTTRTWARCEIIGRTRLCFTSSLGESDRGGEHPGESGWMLFFEVERSRTLGPGRARIDPHAMRTCAGTRFNQVSKTPGMGAIVRSGMLSAEKPSYMLMKTCDSPRTRFKLLFSHHICGALVVGSTDTMIPRRTGRLQRRSWKETPTSRVPL